MQNFFLKFSLIFFILTGNAPAQSCSFREQIKFPDGSIGCLSELALTNEIAKEFKSIERSYNYALAISKNNQCKAVGVAVSSLPANSANSISNLREQPKIALDRCINQGCECEVVIVDGVANANKSSLMAMLVSTDKQSALVSKPPAKEIITPTAPVKEAPILKLTGNAPAQSCSFREQIKFPDGSIGCLSELALTNEIAKEFKSIERSYNYALAISKNNQCKAVGVAVSSLPANSANSISNLREQPKIALDRCINQGCECEVVIVDGVANANKSSLMAMLVSTDKQSALVSKPPAKEIFTPPVPTKEVPISDLKVKEEQSALASKPPAKEIFTPPVPTKEVPISDLKVKEELIAGKKTDGQITALRNELEKEIRGRMQAEAAQKNSEEFKATPAPIRIYANRKALVIGNDAYQKVASLSNAREDARLMAESLINFGFKVQLKLDVTEKQFKSELRNFKNSIQPGDEVAIFYAGHGVQIGSTNYLLPIDIAGQNEEEIKDETIPLQRILDDMNEKGAKFTLAMIDACRDNPFKSSARSIGGTRGLAPTTAATGQMIVFSAGSGQQALDKLGPTDKNKNGLFTRVFVQEMQKTGVTVDRVVRNARSKVVEMAKSVGHNQVPAIYDQVVGEFYFRQ